MNSVSPGTEVPRRKRG